MNLGQRKRYPEKWIAKVGQNMLRIVAVLSEFLRFTLTTVGQCWFLFGWGGGEAKECLLCSSSSSISHLEREVDSWDSLQKSENLSQRISHFLCVFLFRFCHRCKYGFYSAFFILKNIRNDLGLSAFLGHFSKKR